VVFYPDNNDSVPVRRMDGLQESVILIEDDVVHSSPLAHADTALDCVPLVESSDVPMDGGCWESSQSSQPTASHDDSLSLSECEYDGWKESWQSSGPTMSYSCGLLLFDRDCDDWQTNSGASLDSRTRATLSWCYDEQGLSEDDRDASG